MDEATALEHSVHALLTSIHSDLQKESRTRHEDTTMKENWFYLEAQWNHFQKIAPKDTKAKLSAEIRSLSQQLYEYYLDAPPGAMD